MERLKMSKRITAVFCFFFLFCTVLFFRVFSLSAGSGSQALKEVAANQSSYTLSVSQTRGRIYDRNLKKLVNNGVSYKASAVPSVESLAALSEVSEVNTTSTAPILLKLSRAAYSRFFTTIPCVERYDENSLAVHVIGHLDGDGEGVYGVERTLNGYLAENSGKLSISYSVDGLSRPLSSTTPVLKKENYDSLSGVVLTIDSDIQSIAEEVAGKYIKSGAVVVMEAGTGAIRASVSLPEFEPNNIAKDLDNPLYPFVNRAFSAHNVGSTFKLAVAALGLEYDYPTGYTYECKGWIDVGGQVFTCQNHTIPMVMDMETALEKSCNTYFIFLSKVLSANRLLPFAKTLRFGEYTQFYDGYTTASGTLPSLDDLSNPAELANFGFGQGKFTATPVQLAAMVGMIANNGYLPYPYLIEGFTTDGETISEYTSHPTQNRVISKSTADRIKYYMTQVVIDGSGKNALPDEGGAGGKTASAQTGKLDENGEEIVDAWFSGFFPEDNPKYVIVVLNEGMSSGGNYAAPVFKEIADKITVLEKYR